MNDFEDWQETPDKTRKEQAVENILSELKKDPKHLFMDELGEFHLEWEDISLIFSKVDRSQLQAITMKSWPEKMNVDLLKSILSPKIRLITIDEASPEVVDNIIRMCPEIEVLETVVKARHIPAIAKLKKLKRIYNTELPDFMQQRQTSGFFDEVLEMEAFVKAVKENFWGLPLESFAMNYYNSDLLDAFDNCLNLKEIEIHATGNGTTLSYLPERVTSLKIYSENELYGPEQQRKIAETVAEKNITDFYFEAEYVDTDCFCEIFPPMGKVRSVDFEGTYAVKLSETFLDAAKTAEKLTGNLKIDGNGIDVAKTMMALCKAIACGSLKELELEEVNLSELSDGMKRKIAVTLAEALNKGNLRVFMGLEKIFTKENGMMAYYKPFLESLKTSAVHFILAMEREGALKGLGEKRDSVMNEQYGKIKELKETLIGKDKERILFDVVKNDLLKELLVDRKRPLHNDNLLCRSTRTGEYLFEHCLRPMNVEQFYSERMFPTLEKWKGFEGGIPENKKHLIDSKRRLVLRRTLIKKEMQSQNHPGVSKGKRQEDEGR